MTEFDHIPKKIEFDVGIQDVPVKGAADLSPILSTVDRQRVLKTQELSPSVWKQHTEDWSHKLVYIIIDDSWDKILMYVGRQEDKDKAAKDRLQQHIHGETQQTQENAELSNWSRAVVLRAKTGGKEFTIEDTKILEAMLKYRLGKYSNVEMKTKQASKGAQGKQITDLEMLGEYAELVIEYISKQFEIGNKQYQWTKSDAIEETPVAVSDYNVSADKDVKILVDRGILSSGTMLFSNSQLYPAEAVVSTGGGLDIIGFGERDDSGSFKNENQLDPGYRSLTPSGAARMIGNPKANGWDFWKRQSDRMSLNRIWNSAFKDDGSGENGNSQNELTGRPNPEFVSLIDLGVVKVGGKLFARKSRIAEATILSGGYIHVTEAKYQNKSSIPRDLLNDLRRSSLNFACTKISKLRGQGEHNAWQYWLYESDNGELIELRELKDKYL